MRRLLTVSASDKTCLLKAVAALVAVSWPSAS
jgi:hypothetical protein